VLIIIAEPSKLPVMPADTFNEPVINTLPFISRAACGFILFNPILPEPLSNKLPVPRTVSLTNLVI
jgi:hypothetical protein